MLYLSLTNKRASCYNLVTVTAKKACVTSQIIVKDNPFCLCATTRFLYEVTVIKFLHLKNTKAEKIKKKEIFIKK